MARKYTLKTGEDHASTAPSSELLAGLNPRQAEAARHVEGPLLILAGAGSGKTRVMTHRIAHLIANEGVHPREILALTFTNKAAAEMRERVDALLEHRAGDAARVTVSTFHSLCARLLRRHADGLGLSRHFVIYDESDQLALIKRVMEEEERGKDATEARRLRGFIESMKNRGLTPKQAHEIAWNQRAEDDVWFYETYQDALRNANCVDFGDLILGVLELFRADTSLAESYSRAWRFVMVDEFQDTNPAQYELLRHLTCAHENLAVVGDDDQSIYRWRGATVANILGFERDYTNATVVTLDQNYRSTQTILDAANDVIEGNPDRREKRLWTEREAGEPVTVFTARDDREEATFVAERIEEQIRNGATYGDFAIFYRMNAQGRAFEEQLRFLGIPYQVIGGPSFYAREEIKDILAYLKVALNPENEVDLLRVLNKPTRGIGGTTEARLRVAAALPQIGGLWNAIRFAAGAFERPAAEPVETEVWLPGLNPHASFDDPELVELENLSGRPASGVREFYELIEHIRDDLAHHDSLAEVVRHLVERIGYHEHLQAKSPERAEDKARNVEELVTAIDEFERDEELLPLDDDAEGLFAEAAPAVRKLRAFLDRSALLAGTDAIDESVGAVTLMTVHGSKGLEFDTVFIVGMEEEIFPSLRDEDDEELAEERRLAYVAITRARHKLFITNATQRRVYGQTRYTRVSRFLDAIRPERLEQDPRSVSERGIAHSRGHERKGFQYFGDGVDRSAWDFDQSPPMIRNQITNAVKQSREEPAFDEFSQLPSYDESWSDGYVPSPSTPSSRSRRGAGEENLKGATVSHTRFGVGEVVAVSGYGDTATLTIDFPTEDDVIKIKRQWVKILSLASD